jgi:glycerol-3-phosphate dehydrogenase
VQFLFPSLRLTRADILATFAGIRPLVDTDTEDPAKASRDYAVWEEDGLLTVTGGKLTTFRLMALEALRRVRPLLPALPRIDPSEPVENKPAVLPPSLPFTRSTALRLLGRYGSEALTTIAAGPADDLRPIPGIRALWGELRWSARFERVHHLDDLLLRRLRIGLTSPHGGRSFLTAIRPIVQAELEWDDARWQREEATYLRKWQHAHGVPEIPGDEPGH